MNVSAIGKFLHDARSVGLIDDPSRLTPIESETLGRSFRRSRGAVRRLAWTYYGSRVDDAFDAVEWLVSETYTYAIESVVRGDRSIPMGTREWLAIARTIRHRYYASRDIVIDAKRVKFLGDDDTSITTRIQADRLSCDDDMFAAVMIEYACRGLGREVAPDWIVETVVHWSTASDVSWRERADELGVSRETVKSREAKTKAAVRAGILGELVDFAMMTP
jgi:hypothetical protein